MTDYTELIRSLRNCSNNRCNPRDCGWFDKYQVDESCKEIIMWKAAAAIEALQAEVQKRGEWELIDGAEPMRWGCSRCKYMSWETSNYCPRCGAKMEVQDG